MRAGKRACRAARKGDRGARFRGTEARPAGLEAPRRERLFPQATHTPEINSEKLQIEVHFR